MISYPRSLISSIFGPALVLLLTACAPTLTLSASPGEAPGIAMGPFTSGSASATSTISVESKANFTGLVTLSASCCHEAIRDRWVPLDGTGKFTSSLSTNSVNLAANGSATATLSLFIPAMPFTNNPQIPFGKYLVPVGAKNQDGSITQTTNVGVRLLPDSEPAPSCRPQLKVFTLKQALEMQMNASEADPRKTKLVFAVFAQTTPDVWSWTIEDDSSVLPGESLIVLENAVGCGTIGGCGWPKEITTSGCSSAGKTLTVQGGKNSQMTIADGVDRTLVFRKPVCDVPLCVTTHWEDVAVFAEPAFWSVFGGKKMTFKWVKDQ